MKSILIFLYAVATVYSTDYCDKTCLDFKKNVTVPHIGCEKARGFYTSSCKGKPKTVPFTESMKQAVVTAHNLARNYIAGGDDPKLKPASRMATMQWDDELAHLAALNSQMCKFEHDECHTTEKFPYAGQNIIGIIDFPADMEKKLLISIQGLFKESRDVDQSVMDSFVVDDRFFKIGHFTEIMQERNTHVGCGATIIDDHTTQLTCNYAYCNTLQTPVYTSSEVPASNCSTGRNIIYHNLCSEKEEYEFI